MGIDNARGCQARLERDLSKVGAVVASGDVDSRSERHQRIHLSLEPADPRLEGRSIRDVRIVAAEKRCVRRNRADQSAWPAMREYTIEGKHLGQQFGIDGAPHGNKQRAITRRRDLPHAVRLYRCVTYTGAVKLFGKKPSAVPEIKEIDPAWGDEQARSLRAGLTRGKWRDVHAAMEAAKRNWDDRQFLLEVLADAVTGWPKWLDEWVEAYPQSASGWTMRGAQGIRWAWEARGGGKAETVKDDNWQIFWSRLEEAERDLYKAAELEPDDPVPWTQLVIVARGLERGIPEVGERLNQAHARHPWHHVAFSQAMQGYAKKWGGSHELMLDLVRQTAGAPEGASVHTLVAEAHVERWVYMAGWDKDEAGAREYWLKPSVGEDLRAAAARSVWSPNYEKPRLAPWDHNFFTYCFFRAHDWESARRELEAMNGVLNRYPWAYVGKPIELFRVIRERILKGK